MISIVMPTYNREEYLAEAIESVIGQEYKDWELIIVDDGSTDSTRDLLDYYRKKDKRIATIHFKSNKGIAKARQTGVEASSGEYIAVMDSDDIMNPTRLKMALKTLEKSKADVVYSSYYIADSNGKIQYPVLPPSKVTKEDIQNDVTVPHVTIVARRYCFVDNGYDAKFVANDDKDLLHKWWDASYTFKRIREPSMIVRIHPESVSVKKNKLIKKLGDKINRRWK